MDEAFTSAGVSKAKAKAAVESINREIDRRYSLHAPQLVTKGGLAESQAMVLKDLAEVKVDIFKWDGRKHVRGDRAVCDDHETAALAGC